MSPSRRLQNRDYSASGLYFVTVCSDFKRCIFGTIIRTRVELSALGRIAHESWMAIAFHFACVNLHGFVIMPNNVHGILEIVAPTRAQQVAPGCGTEPAPCLRTGSLSVVVRSFKAEVTRRGRLELDWKGEIWQRNYFDRVIRDGQEFSNASRYIAENPVKWELDRENPKAIGDKKSVAQHAVPLQRTRRTDSV